MFPRHSLLKLYVPVILLTTVACASQPLAGPNLPALSKSGGEEFLVEEGESSQPFYSPTGDRLLFISRKRSNHNQPQVYEKVLANGEERRLTFQTGSTYSPRYHPKEAWFVYASTTDELKENPPLLNPQKEPSSMPEVFQTPSEIYIHSLNGLEIIRVTDRLGFDGNPQFSPDGRRLIWTRVLKDRTQVITLDRQAHTTQQLGGLGANPADYSSSADKKANAWVDWDEKFETSKLNLKRLGESKPLEINAQHVVAKLDPAFSPDSKFLVWSQLNAVGQHYEIWIYGLESKCAYRVIGSDSADRRHPVFSPDMRKLTYTYIRDERSRIANLPFVAPTGPCPDVE